MPAESALRAAGSERTLDYYPNRIIVKFASDAAVPEVTVTGEERQLHATSHEAAGTVTDALPSSVLYQNFGPARFARFLAKQYGMTIEQEAYVRNVNWACFAVDSPGQAEELLTSLTAAYPRQIEYAEFDGRFEVEFTPNDPSFPGSMWGMVKIGAETAWDTTAGEGMKIAVIDSGVRYDGNTPSSLPDHEDLNDNVLHPPDYWPNEKLDFVDDDNIPDDDNYGHGTHVSGIAAAMGDNGVGVVGVAYEADIIPVKIFDLDSPLYYSRVIQAITLATELGADVVNMSFAGTSLSLAMREAIDDAYDQGILLVAAAGNKARTKPYYPAAYPKVMAVGATKHDDGKWSDSNYGPWLDIAAPGMAIYSTYHRFRTDYNAMSGTSMAAPHVAGAGALLMAAYPELTVAQVRAILEGSGADLPDSEWENTTIKRLDVGAAMSYSLGSPPTVSITSPEHGSTVSGLVIFSANANDSDGTVLKVYFYVGDYSLAIDTTSPFSSDWDTAKFPNASYELRAIACDNQGQRAVDTVTVTVDNSSLTPNYFNDFESGTGGWWILDEGGIRSWHLTTQDAYSPTHSFKMGDTGGGSYGAGEYDLLFSPVFDLSGIEHARVKFYHRYSFEYFWDQGCVTVNTGDGEYHVIASYTGTQPAWTFANLLLDDFIGKSAHIVFLMESNFTLHYEGWYIDDFRLVKSSAPPTVELTSHENNEVVSGTITITATASDDVEVSKVEFYVDDALFATDTIAPYSFERDTLYLHGGDRVFRATAYDEFPLTASDEVTLVVQNHQVNTCSPNSATAGTTVRVWGNRFLALGGDSYNPSTDKVLFTGVSGLVEAEVSTWSPTEIDCKVPADAVIGPVHVAIGSASVSTQNDFLIKPAISSLDPDAQIVGSTVTIHGTGFLPQQGEGRVSFNGLQAPDIVSWSNRSINVVVPGGVTAGPVKVTTEVATSGGIDFHPIPHITGLSSGRAYVGKAPFTLTGTSFGASGTVYFHENVAVPPQNIFLWQGTQIVLKVPEGPISGDTYVIVNGYESNHLFVTITLPPPALKSLVQR